ncbi:MAG: family NAD(P)-dependent oxidoreductase [Bacteroidetes bacterium]|jgi:uncharacterized oxidoreductase|nr:family NAD(P)-dependent oxidoreductase [Bacteroidota bacterium]
MKTTENTVLVTGGGSGIGFEIAKAFHKLGNEVIITGRNPKKLEAAAEKIGGAQFFVCDITSEYDVKNLIRHLEKNFPKINILVNNAGEANLHNLKTGDKVFKNASSEIMTNYLSVVRLVEKLLPTLLKKESAIVNVSSLVAFSPAESLPTYSASKAALHSYTQILRHTLRSTPVKVFELMPPLVDTDMTTEIHSPNKLNPSLVAAELMNAMTLDNFEIKVASTNDFYHLYLSSPEKALEYLNSN